MGRLKMLSFQQEISLMEFFADSVYVAKLIGFCTEPVCLVMKYYPLGSLDKWCISNRQLVQRSSVVKLAIIGNVAQGISALNARQVAHCDVKSQNILVEQVMKNRFRFLLTDFGISKILTDDYLASEAFQIRNLRGLTVAYAAPEALNRFRQKSVISKPAEEKSADIFSFGVLIYYVFTQCEPWSA
jgi:serine/threonine protein kinase